MLSQTHGLITFLQFVITIFSISFYNRFGLPLNGKTYMLTYVPNSTITSSAKPTIVASVISAR